MLKMLFRPGLRPDHWGSIQHSPRSSSWFSGVLLLRRGVKERGKKREGRKRKGEGKEMGREGRGKGESLAPQPSEGWRRHCL